MSKRIIAGLGVVAGLGVALAPVATFADTLYPNTHQDKLSVTIEKVCSFGYTYTDGTAVKTGTHTNGEKISGVSANPDHVTHDSKDKGLSYGVWAVDSNWTAGAGRTGEISAYDVQITGTGAPTAGSTTVLTDTAYGIMENDTANTNFAKTKLNVVCNNAKGYAITALSEDLVKSAGDTTPIANTAAEPTAGTTNWSFTVAAAANDKSASPETPETDDNREVTVASGWQAAKSANTIVTVSQKTGKSASTPKYGDSYQITYGVGLSATQDAGTYEGTITYTLAQTL